MTSGYIGRTNMPRKAENQEDMKTKTVKQAKEVNEKNETDRQRQTEILTENQTDTNKDRYS